LSAIRRHLEVAAACALVDPATLHGCGDGEARLLLRLAGKDPFE
jgi:hypothetical protein